MSRAPNPWPQEVPKAKVYGNFRTPAHLRPERIPRYRTREGMSAEHLASVRRLPCAICGVRTGIDAHHLKAGIHKRGVGMKNPDCYAVPLCRYPHHEELERLGSLREPGFFRDHGIDDVIFLAGRLWAERHNQAAQHAIMAFHCGRSWQRARLERQRLQRQLRDKLARKVHRAAARTLASPEEQPLCPSSSQPSSPRSPSPPASPPVPAGAR